MDDKIISIVEKPNEVINMGQVMQEATQELQSSFIHPLFDHMKSLSNQAKMDNVAIFIDYDNVFWTLKKHYLHDPDSSDPEKNLFTKLMSTYDRDKVRIFKAFADFEQIDSDMTSLQKKRVQIRHVYANGKRDDHRKNSSDIELCLDAIESTYKDPNITCYFFITADSDMIPIMSRLMYKGKKVILYYVPSATSKQFDITSYAHESINLLEFLNVEVHTYKIEDYILNSLKLINNWVQRHQDNVRLFLGSPVLSKIFMEDLQIPRDVSSELIEYLENNAYIHSIIKDITDRDGNVNQKKSYTLTEVGQKYLKELESEAAATEEKVGTSS